VSWIRIRIRIRLDPARKLSVNLNDIYLLLCLRCKTPDDGHRNCPKHVEFYSKNRFEKLMHLGGFIKRIFHGAGSPELQILSISFPVHYGLSLLTFIAI